jgi:hypothetical protein
VQNNIAIAAMFNAGSRADEFSVAKLSMVNGVTFSIQNMISVINGTIETVTAMLKFGW